MAAGARVNSVFFDMLLFKLSKNSLVFMLVILMGIQIYKIETSITEQANYSVLFCGIIVLFVDTLLLFSNQQYSTLPLSVVFSLLLVNRIISYNQEGKTIRAELSRPFHQSLVISGGLFFLFFFAVEIAGLGFGVLQKIQVSNRHPAVEFSEPRLASLVLFDNKEPEPRSNGSLYRIYK